MLSIAYATPLRIELHPSRLYRYYLIAIHLLVLVAALQPMRAGWYLNVAMLILVIGSAWRFWPAICYPSQPAIWIWRHSDRWYEVETQKEWLLQHINYLSPWIIIVTLNTPLNQETKRLCLWRDQLPDQDYRALYARLKFWVPTNTQAVGE